METADYAPPMDPDRVTRAEAAQILGVSLARFDVIAREHLTTRQHNELRNRTTYARTEVDDLRRRREGS